MKNITLTLSILLLLVSCSGTTLQKKDPNGDPNIYSDSTSALTISSEKIDKGITYELFFTLEKGVKCLTVDIKAVYIPGTFPLERIPKKTYFIVEKIISTEILFNCKSQFTNCFILNNLSCFNFCAMFYNFNTRNYTYTQLARNFNNDWETFNPVQICGLEGDPLSGIDPSNYRIRFTVFESQPVIFMATIFSFEKIIFRESIDRIIP